MASRKKKDKGQQAIDKRMKEMERQHKEADKIAADDANMVLKASKGASVQVENLTPPRPDTKYGRTKGGGRAPKVPIKLPDDKKKTDEIKPDTRAKGGTHRSACGCDMCGGGEMVRGMGRAYQGNPRAAKIR